MAEAKRVYQVWKGRNKFFFGGRCMFGPDVGSLSVTLTLILAPVIIFCALVARNLLHEFPSRKIGYAILVVLLLLLTSGRDPGIVPRNPYPPEEMLGYESPASVEVSEYLQKPQYPRTREIFVNGLPVRVKYCETCMVFRPPRCSHCSICDNCVERFDHHCPWIGQCIGKRNYRSFFLFISSSALLCIMVLSTSVLHLKLRAESYGAFWKAMKESPASVVLIAYCFVLLWFIGGLTGFHVYLMCSNQTTYENFRRRSDSRINVYDRGCKNNLLEILFAKTEPSRIKLRSYITDQEVINSGSSYRPQKNRLREDKREKVEEDVEIGNDLLKISQRRASVDLS
ncbi:DHHC-type zinc finger family protein [Striga asiatica]|uniref:S-acyltransferase n=1 Tax=Striga asiatica TaxID=4170 RepID=A0A5A7PQN2_STRAF|nr:DHHC-type zinc finger family protein [Striga asiatica]